MIQWCKDCKYNFTTDNYQDERCGECIDESEAGEIPVRYEQAGDLDATKEE